MKATSDLTYYYYTNLHVCLLWLSFQRNQTNLATIQFITSTVKHYCYRTFSWFKLRLLSKIVVIYRIYNHSWRRLILNLTLLSQYFELPFYQPVKTSCKELRNRSIFKIVSNRKTWSMPNLGKCLWWSSFLLYLN